MLLEVENLVTRFYTSEGVVSAVNGISYTVNQDEIVAIVGESGCGKSVGVRSVMRLIPQPPGKIESGRVMFKGRDLLKLNDEAMRKIRGNEIAMIFQDPMTSLNPVLTIERQITEALEQHGKAHGIAARLRATELLEMVSIPNPKARLKDYPYQFSGGMRQRAMIAMALACEPDLLIADEPTTALDVTIQSQIVNLVRRLQQRTHMAVIWITHDLGVVARLAQRVMVMYAGYIIEAAPVKDLYADPRHPYTLGLLGSLPRLDAPPNTKLASIPGHPPDQVALPAGCPFAPRCSMVIERCLTEMPPEEFVSDQHRVACWRKDETQRAHVNGGQRVEA
ncbi:MAG TPA: ABC transporter ATP-binding protein [Aggregatilinea sp.]|uniref:ABC transporter ATP-binding protein n=1 Tax=Aggregatilinea sp. TaxID=2806333 RepID=UPI002C976275|nr:ABC transporter ATP-binding protein [Aggregatilinea sp.]HML20280.1 ABC transporter ATP-binding protein [Aggregatilinea sp.]